MWQIMLWDHPIRNGIGGICGDILDAAVKQCSSLGEKITTAVTGGGLVQEAMNDSGVNITSIMTNGVDALKSTGYAICALFFIISLLELAMSERMTLEFFVKFFSKLVIGVAAVFYAGDFVNAAWNFGDTLSNYLSTISLVDGEASGVVEVGFHDLFITYLNEVEGSQWLAMLAIVIGLGIPAALASFIIVAVVYVVCFTRLLEIMVRGVFMPIACAMLSDDGWRGAGGRYIRKFIGICAQGAVMVIIGKLTGVVMGAVCNSMKNTMTETVNDAIASASKVTPGFGFVIDVIESTMAIVGIAVACISLMFKSIGIVNDAFGG